MNIYIVLVAKRLIKLGLSQAKAKYLVENFGRQTDQILDSLESNFDNSTPQLSLLKAELDFCLQNEMICTLQDFLVRRTGLMYFNIKVVEDYKQPIAQENRSKLRLSDEKLVAEMKQIDLLIDMITSFSLSKKLA